MRLRPALLLAAPAGVLGGHAIGYLAAPGAGAGAGAGAVHHGHLPLVLAIAVPLAVMAVAWAATAGAGGAGRTRAVPVGPLLVAQWVLFTGQEAGEHALAGHGPAAALQSRALWWGLAAQVVTALAVVVLLRASSAAGARLVVLTATLLPVVLRVLRWCLPRLSWPPLSSPASASSARGPPAPRFA